MLAFGKQVKSAPEVVEEKAAGLQSEAKPPLAKISVSDFFGKLKRKTSPPKSAADLGFLKRDLGRLGKFLSGGEAKAAELQVNGFLSTTNSAHR